MSDYPQKKIYHLRDLNRSIQKLLKEKTDGRTWWVKCEISQARVRNGHMYLELAEEREGIIVAKTQAIIWQRDLQAIRHALGGQFEEILKSGREVVFQAGVEFHLVYGLKYIIYDVDLSFTLGEIEKRKQETMRALAAEDLVDRNKQIPLPIIVQRIALVGAPDSAGWADFTEHLERNPNEFRFEITPFPTQVQGKEAPVLIKGILEGIQAADFDAIVLIRGGGSPIDLDVFNDYHLAKCIALLPLPVITGIGHETDMHVADLVANRSLKTPTAVAEFLLGMMREYASRVWEAFQSIRLKITNSLEQANHHFDRIKENFAFKSINYTQLERGRLSGQANSIRHLTLDHLFIARQHLQKSGSKVGHLARNNIQDNRKTISDLKKETESLSYQLVRQEAEKLKKLQSAVNTLHPDNLLKLGLSIVRKQGRILGPEDEIKVDDSLQLNLYKRDIDVRVDRIKKEPWKKKS